MKTKFWGFLIIVQFLATGCATGYHPLGPTGGYREVRLSENTFKILFFGNGFTSDSKAQGLAMLRATEVTLNNHFNYFVIENNVVENDESSFMMPATSDTTIYQNGNHIYSSTTYTPSQTYTTSKPRALFIIKTFKTYPEHYNKPETDIPYIGTGIPYDATNLLRIIKEEYGMK